MCVPQCDIFAVHRLSLLQQGHWNHKRTTQFLLHLPRQSYSLYEKGARASSVSQYSHSATYTHLSHTALCTNSNCICILTQEKTQPILECAQPTQVTHSHCRAHAHIHTYGCVSQAVEIGQLTEVLLSVLVVLQSRSVKHFLLSLMFLLHRTLINILYGFYMDLFSFLLLSPRGAMATFSCLFNDCGWTINNLHTSKHSTTPTRCWRFNFKGEAKDMFSLKGTWKSCWLGS